MKCPFCQLDNDRVIDSRASADGAAIRRRRECLGCKKRYTTYERVERTTVRVIKKDGTRVPFDRDKIKQGLEKACWKRPISDDQLEAILSAVENELERRLETEVESRRLWSSLALSAVGGLISSTIFILIVIPIFYYYGDRIRGFASGKIGEFKKAWRSYDS